MGFASVLYLAVLAPGECAAIRQLMLGNEVKIFEDDETCVDVFTEYSMSFKMSGYVALLSDVQKI